MDGRHGVSPAPRKRGPCDREIPPGRKSRTDASSQPQAVLDLSSSSCARAPATMHDASDVSITMSKPRFTAPAANAAPAQCMTHLMPRIRVIAARRQAQCERQIGWPDIDSVEAGCGADSVEIGDALLSLDHGHDHDLVVRFRLVVGAAVVHGAHRPRRAHADGRIAAGGHRFRGFLGVVDQGDDDAHRAKVQGLHDGRRLVPGDPHHRDRVGLRDRLQHGQDVFHFSGAVLQIDAQRIEALTRHDLGREPVRHGEPAQRRALPGSPHLLDLVRSHRPTSGVVD